MQFGKIRVLSTGSFRLRQDAGVDSCSFATPFTVSSPIIQACRPPIHTIEARSFDASRVCLDTVVIVKLHQIRQYSLKPGAHI